MPHVEAVTFERNFIRVAVCELRFPELPVIDPDALAIVQKQLRPHYPHHEKPAGVALSPTRVETAPPKHLFKSRGKDWTVSMSASAMSVETSSYGSFEHLADRVRDLLSWTVGYRDADFFTRVGVRYVTVFPLRDPDVVLKEWVNPTLVQPLSDGTYGDVSAYAQQIDGIANPGHYVFKHGFTPTAGPPDNGPVYVFDIDFFEENVEASNVRQLVRGLHGQIFDLFSWAIGPAARRAMGPATPKKVPSQ